MTYATQADLERRFGEAEVLQLSDRDANGMPDPWVIDMALSDAAAEINAHLRAIGIPLPIAPPVPDLLVRIACDIARYRLWADRASEEVRDRYEDARRQLELIAKGLISLGIEPSGSPSQGRAAAASGSARVFGRANTIGY